MGAWVVNFFAACFEGFRCRHIRTRAPDWLPFVTRADSGRKCGSRIVGKLCMFAN
jgi:hypothetical protein